MYWAEVMDRVAAALAARQLPDAEGDPDHPVSMLTAVTGSVPPGLRRRLRLSADRDTPGGQTEPLIYQNAFPVRLLAAGVLPAAAEAVADLAGQDCPAVTAAVAVAALSTLRLEPAEEAAALLHVHRRMRMFASPGWAEALDSLAARTAELAGLLGGAAGDRRHGWQKVPADDRILAEALAAAVVGGAAEASGVPPAAWLFPFHLFCSLGVSAAASSLTTIERWLGIEFQPGPHTAERLAGLAGLVAGEASVLCRGCQCKAAAQDDDLAFVRRGECRQDDHDLRAWRPGQPKPGSRGGARYASTLWGWQRRWLGGADFGRAVAAQPAARPKLRANDVAASVLARRWLSADRGFGGPVLRYDRILPEFCLNCDGKVTLISVHGAGGRTMVQRAPCCPEPRIVYRSEFIWRGGRRLLRPKLGIVVASQSAAAGNAGYASTEPLGPIWVCRESGRYSRSGSYCPACGPEPEWVSQRAHERLHHGWVLLPLADAWADLRATAGPAETGAAAAAADGAVDEADLRFLADVCSQMPPGVRRRFGAPAEVWALAKGWSSAEMNSFTNLAGQRGLELVLRCMRIAGQHRAQADRRTLNSHDAPGTRCNARSGPESKRGERIVQGD